MPTLSCPAPNCTMADGNRRLEISAELIIAFDRSIGSTLRSATKPARPSTIPHDDHPAPRPTVTEEAAWTTGSYVPLAAGSRCSPRLIRGLSRPKHDDRSWRPSTLRIAVSTHRSSLIGWGFVATSSSSAAVSLNKMPKSPLVCSLPTAPRAVRYQYCPAIFEPAIGSPSWTIHTRVVFTRDFESARAPLTNSMNTLRPTK